MLDRTEIAILRVLEEEARLSYAELADKVALSKTPCWARVRDLEQRGVIKGYRTELDPGAAGTGDPCVHPRHDQSGEARGVRSRRDPSSLGAPVLHDRRRRRLPPARARAEHHGSRPDPARGDLAHARRPAQHDHGVPEDDQRSLVVDRLPALTSADKKGEGAIRTEGDGATVLRTNLPKVRNDLAAARASAARARACWL